MNFDELFNQLNKVEENKVANTPQASEVYEFKTKKGDIKFVGSHVVTELEVKFKARESDVEKVAKIKANEVIGSWFKETCLNQNEEDDVVCAKKLLGLFLKRFDNVYQMQGFCLNNKDGAMLYETKKLSAKINNYIAEGYKSFKSEDGKEIVSLGTLVGEFAKGIKDINATYSKAMEDARKIYNSAIKRAEDRKREKLGEYGNIIEWLHYTKGFEQQGEKLYTKLKDKYLKLKEDGKVESLPFSQWSRLEWDIEKINVMIKNIENIKGEKAFKEFVADFLKNPSNTFN
jgi:hypothetical protein